MSTTISELARFDARLPREQKIIFERAALLGGYRNLTDFIFQAAQEKALDIIKENERIISSVRDSQVFYEAITKPAKPSEALKNAWKDYEAFNANSEEK